MARAESITSAANPLIKDVRRAVARGTLTAQGLCVAETFHLLEEALRSDCEVRTVLAAESVRGAAEKHVRGLPGVHVAVLPDPLFQQISATETAQGVMALVKPPEWKLEQVFRGCPLVVVLDGLQDPGNAGTIARAAEAFGASGMLFLKGSVSAWNPKVIRASAGSLFRVPFLHGVDVELARAALKQNRVEWFAGVPANSRGAVMPLAQADLTRRCALVIGSEAHGVSEKLRGAATDVSIPTTGVESLNAAVAAGILLYEARRQRMRSE
ncbi:MAG: RNA methyltransferase [Acidobacteriota bacterium]|nr:RNA methyltransferase [Acidobacteriota bacterium]